MPIPFFSTNITLTTRTEINNFIKDLYSWYIPDLKKHLLECTNFINMNEGFAFNTTKLDEKLSEEIKDFINTLRNLIKFLDNKIKNFNQIKIQTQRAEQFKLLNNKITSSFGMSGNNEQTVPNGGKRHRKNQTRRHTNRRKRSQRHY
jgi:hypothetical protein